MKKTLLTNTIFNILYKILNIVFGLVSSIYLARVLGPSNLGKVSYAQSIMSYFLVIASLGIPTYGMREIANVLSKNGNENKTFSEIFMINAASSMLCSVIYTIFIFAVSPYNHDLWLYICVGLTLYMNIFNVDWFWFGHEEYVYITTRSIVIKLLSLAIIIFAVRNPDSYIIYALISSLATTGNYVFNIIKMRNKVAITVKNLDLRKHFKPIFILLVASLATDLYNQIDVTMLGVMCSDATVGYYSNAVKMIRMIYIVTTAISATTLPKMSKYFSIKKYAEFNELFCNTLENILLISIPCVIGLQFIAASMVNVLYGSSFSPSGDIIFILAPIILIVSISYQFGSVVLTATINEKRLLISTIVGVIVNLVLNVILIPRYGMYGAAVASLCAEAGVLISNVFFSKKYVKVRLKINSIISLVLASLGLIITEIICRQVFTSSIKHMIFSMIFGVIIYVLILLLAKNPMAVKFKNIIAGKLKNNRQNAERK